MPDEVTPKEFEQLRAKVDRLDEKVDKIAEDMGKLTESLTLLAASLERIENQMKLSALETKTAADELFLKKHESLADAMARLDVPSYRHKAASIIDDWMESDHGMNVMEKCFSKCMERTRDNTIKWLNFWKVVGGIIALSLVTYGGNTIIQTQKTNQKALLKQIEQVKGE